MDDVSVEDILGELYMDDLFESPFLFDQPLIDATSSCGTKRTREGCIIPRKAGGGATGHIELRSQSFSSGSCVDTDSSNPSCRATDVHKKRESHNIAEKKRVQRMNESIQELRMVTEAMSNIVLSNSPLAPIKASEKKKEKIVIIEEAIQALDLMNQKLSALKAQREFQNVIARSFKVDSIQAVPVIHDSIHDLAPDVSSSDFKTFFQSEEMGRVIMRLDGSFVHCNNAFIKLTNFSVNEIRQYSMFSLTPASDMDKTSSELMTLLNDTDINVLSRVKRCNFKEGTKKVFASMQIMRDGAGKPTHISCTCFPFDSIMLNDIRNKEKIGPLSLERSSKVEELIDELDMRVIASNPFLDFDDMDLI